MTLKHTCTIRLQFPSSELAETIYEATKLEQDALPNPRIKVSSKLEKDTLIFFFEASDLVALRAGINSHLKWVMVASEVSSTLEEIDNQKSH